MSTPTPTPDTAGTTASLRRRGSRRPGRLLAVATTAWGWFMIAMAGINGSLAVSGQAQVYVDFAEDTYVGLYDTAWQTLVAPHPLPWVLALTVFEFLAGVMTLRSGRIRLAGLWASAAFIVALTPASPYTLGNPLLAALPASLAIRHQRHERSLHPSTETSGD